MQFLTIVDIEVGSEITSSVGYARTAEEAVAACGIELWERALPANAVRKLELGDELNLKENATVIRISGKEINYE